MRILAGVVAICPALFSTFPNRGREFVTSDKARCTSSVRGLQGSKVFSFSRMLKKSASGVLASLSRTVKGKT